MIEPISGKPQIRVGLVQINNSYSNQNYLPLSVGLIQAYCLKHLPRPQDYHFLLPVYARIPVDRAVQEMREADIVFFSTYVWNFRISLESARRLKEEKPESVIVFGGPHVPDRGVEEYHRRYPFIDLACHGEGESLPAISDADFQVATQPQNAITKCVERDSHVIGHSLAYHDPGTAVRRIVFEQQGAAFRGKLFQAAF